eukprot:1420920-Amphidinium_carterae.8
MSNVGWTVANIGRPVAKAIQVDARMWSEARVEAVWRHCCWESATGSTPKGQDRVKLLRTAHNK